MAVDLKKVALGLVIGFFALVFIGANVTPYKTFIASTRPDVFPFTLGDGVQAMSVTSLPDDHVVLCYVDGGTLYYKESYTRGFAWFEARPVIATNLTAARNLHARAVAHDGEHDLYLSWDALVVPGNESTRRAFHAVIDLATFSFIKAPSRCSPGGDDGYEVFPTITGDVLHGFYMAWATNSTGNWTIEVVRGPGLDSWAAVGNVSHGDVMLSHPAVVSAPDGRTDLLYLATNATHQDIIARPVSTSEIGEARVILSIPVVDPPVVSLDYSLTSKNDILVSFHDPASGNTSFIFRFPGDDPAGACLNETIANNSRAFLFQHVAFSNDQVLAIWIETGGAGEGGENRILFTITVFEMTNRNSIYHSMLLAYIFLACGVFNQFVFLELKRKNRFTKESEPLNFTFTTVAFVTLGLVSLVPQSGFVGEHLGESHADGFIYPAPINLGTLIVIGFVFLFYIVSTPLIDRYWRRGSRPEPRGDLLHIKELEAPYSLKQEFIRKLPHLCMAVLILGFDPIGSHLMHFTDIQKYNYYNFINEGGIIFDYVLRLNNLEIGSYAVKLLMGSGIVFLWVLDLHVLLAPKKWFFMKDYLVYAFRKKEQSTMADFVVMFLSILLMIIFLTFNPETKMQGTFVALAGIATLCFADSAGVFVGKTLGRHRLSPRARKTWEGAIAGTLTAFLVSLPFLTWPFALVVAGAYLLVDLATPKLPMSDNILVPLVITAIFIFLLPLVESPLWALYMG